MQILLNKIAKKIIIVHLKFVYVIKKQYLCMLIVEFT